MKKLPVFSSACRGSRVGRRVAGGASRASWAATLVKRILVLAFSLQPSAFSLASDWPQLQHDAARTGYTADVPPPPPHKLLWAVQFAPGGGAVVWDAESDPLAHSYQAAPEVERFGRLAQPVVCQGRVFIGTKEGYMRAVRAGDGKELWKFQAGGPILHTAGCVKEAVIFGCLDGNVYAVGAADGALKWKFEGAGGFSSAPCILEAQGIVMLGCRPGIFYALDAAGGAKLWEYDAGSPILGSAASDGALVYFGPEDMRIRALAVKTGKEAWISEPLFGGSMRGRFPVAHKGRIAVRTTLMLGAAYYTVPRFNMEGIFGNASKIKQMVLALDDEIAGASKTGADDGELDAFLDAIDLEQGDINFEKLSKFRLPEKYIQEQDVLVKWYRDNPENQTFFLLDARTGGNQGILPQSPLNSLDGFLPAPAVDCEGFLVVPWAYLAGCWARFDVETGRAIDYLYPLREEASPQPFFACDENKQISCAGPYIFIVHASDSNGYAGGGVYNLLTRKFRLSPAPAPLQRPWMLYNVQPGHNAASIAGGRCFNAAWRTLYAFGGK